MDVVEVVKLSFFLVLGIAVAIFQVFIHLPRHWDGRSRKKDERTWSLFSYSAEYKAGMVRLIPSMTLAGVGLMLGSAGVLWNEVSGSRVLSGLPLVLVLSGVACFLLYGLLHYTVVYRNWPKFVVAPHYRSDRGAVQVRRDEGRLWRSRLRLLRNALIFIGIVTGIVSIMQIAYG